MSWLTHLLDRSGMSPAPCRDEPNTLENTAGTDPLGGVVDVAGFEEPGDLVEFCEGPGVGAGLLGGDGEGGGGVACWGGDGLAGEGVAGGGAAAELATDLVGVRGGVGGQGELGVSGGVGEGRLEDGSCGGGEAVEVVHGQRGIGGLGVAGVEGGDGGWLHGGWGGVWGGCRCGCGAVGGLFIKIDGGKRPGRVVGGEQRPVVPAGLAEGGGGEANGGIAGGDPEALLGAGCAAGGD